MEDFLKIDTFSAKVRLIEDFNRLNLICETTQSVRNGLVSLLFFLFLYHKAE